MTAFAPNQIPSDIDTLEKLLVWACKVYQHLNPLTLAVNDIRDQQSTIVSSVVQNDFTTQSTTPFTYYYSARLIVPLDVEWAKYGWEHKSVISLNETPIPTEFTT